MPDRIEDRTLSSQILIKGLNGYIPKAFATRTLISGVVFGISLTLAQYDNITKERLKRVV